MRDILEIAAIAHHHATYSIMKSKFLSNSLGAPKLHEVRPTLNDERRSENLEKSRSTRMIARKSMSPLSQRDGWEQGRRGNGYNTSVALLVPVNT